MEREVNVVCLYLKVSAAFIDTCLISTEYRIYCATNFVTISFYFVQPDVAFTQLFYFQYLPLYSPSFSLPRL